MSVAGATSTNAAALDASATAITTAQQGTTVQVELSVDEGYQVRSLGAAGVYGTSVTVERSGGLSYIFLMPADDVCVTLTLEPQGTAAATAAESLDITSDNVHILNANSAYHTGNLIYDTITLSGEGAAENSYVTVARLQGAYTTVQFYEQEYSVYAGDGDVAAGTGLGSDAATGTGGGAGEAAGADSGAGASDGAGANSFPTIHRITGVPVTQYIRQYIADPSVITNDTLVTFEAKDGTCASYTWGQLNALTYNSYADDTAQPITRGLPVLLAFGQDGTPYTDNAIHLVFGQQSAIDNNAARNLGSITRIVVGNDVNYAQHCYGTYDNLDTVGGSNVVINVYAGDTLQSTKTYTVKDIEALANANKAGIYRGLYSTLVYESTETEYSGPYSDFYEGYSLYDVLLSAGLPESAAAQNPQASVQFYQKGEWDSAWKTVNVSLGYIAGNGAGGVGDYSANVTMYGREDGSSSDGVAIYGMAPTIAYGKNNLPLVYASGTTGVSATAYNYRGPLIAMLPQNETEGGYVASQTVSACYLGQIDVYLPAPEEPVFTVAQQEYTPRSGYKLVTYTGTLEQGQCVEVAGKKMFVAADAASSGVGAGAAAGAGAGAGAAGSGDGAGAGDGSGAAAGAGNGAGAGAGTGGSGDGAGDGAASSSNAPVCLLPAAQADALTNASFTVTSGTAPTFTRGDANANGLVNIVDCQIAYDVACGVYSDFTLLNEAGWLACDIDLDAVVDANDALYIQRVAIPPF